MKRREKTGKTFLRGISRKQHLIVRGGLREKQKINWIVTIPLD